MTPANIGNPLYAPTVALIRNLLHNPYGVRWTVQGFGMLRCYFEEDKRFRLNVWHSALAVKNVSTIHDHPWHLRSYIIAGEMRNTRYDVQWSVAGPVATHRYQKIQTGEGGGPVEEPRHCRLMPRPVEILRPGDWYAQRANEIHLSEYTDGTVTLNERERLEDGEHAYVFWPKDGPWVDAEPREATKLEVLDACRAALEQFP